MPVLYSNLFQKFTQKNRLAMFPSTIDIQIETVKENSIWIWNFFAYLKLKPKKYTRTRVQYRTYTHEAHARTLTGQQVVS